MAWTAAQKSAIDTRNKNLLVSAAAGSGKTRVLVQRIISMISEGDKPMDIDHLLVVTFTNAAAAEMRERIGKAIEQELINNPDNLHLQKQMSLLQSAQITTIHSFCLNVIRNYFHRIDLDPSFKIAEESEITLMKSDVIAQVLERWYEEGREDFHLFIESYAQSKSDTPVENLILQLFNFSMSDPWPKAWLEDKRKMFDLVTMEELNRTDWIQELIRYVEAVLGDLQKKNAQALAISYEADGPSAYQAALLSDRQLLESLCSVSSYEDYSGLFSNITYDRLSSKKEEGVAPWKKERIKELREEVKKGIKDLANQFFFQSPEEMLKDIQAVREVIHVLFELTIEFMEEFAKKKEEKNLIDFNDLEHFALKLLVEEQETHEGDTVIHRKVPTVAAMELSEQFEEVLIDEYQDSNMVQETILQSISRERLGTPNRFMVGDVKQSIYKFRLAMPEIFMQKYDTYSTKTITEDGEINLFQRIDLDKNFRSRKVVLEYVNNIFEQIMQKPVGGIVYDEAASLKYGELYQEELPQELKSRLAQEVELLLVTEEELDQKQVEASEKYNKDNANQDKYVDSNIGNDVMGLATAAPTAEASATSKDELEEVEYTRKEIEARAIARKIRQLTDPDTGMIITDKDTNKNRPATYRDIVILLRSMTGWSEIFVNTLMSEGIAAYADTGTGYFQTLEIMTLLNMLRIIDNPRQDIPLVGVLYSPIVSLTTTELAIIRVGNRNTSMYTAVLTYAEEGTDENLRAKLIQFTLLLEDFRSMVNHKPIHEIIQMILDRTGYYYIAMAMPGGERRKANIDMLISQAVRFEKGSYSGLFHFIRYIEKLHKYEVDFGEAATSGEQDNTVRIMSIHKSKGLEFPIVFVAGMSKQFNTQDLRSKIVLHSEFGIGPEYIDSKLRTKVPTLLKKVIQKKVQIENLGEELRVLYVAMTRAKEKLILTGYLKSLEDMKGNEFSFFELLSAKSYMDFVLPAMLNRMGIKPKAEHCPYVWQKEGMSITITFQRELLKREMERQLSFQLDQENLKAINPENIYDSDLKEDIKTRFNYEYPFQREAGLKIKMTVSELKKLGQFIDEEHSVNMYEKPVSEEPLQIGKPEETSAIYSTQTIPAFLRKEEAVLTGTDRGTLYHKVLELIDLTKTISKSDLEQEYRRLIERNRLSDAEVGMLKQDYILKFVTSDVAERMRKAQANGKLYKEKQFVIGIPASEVMEAIESKELILIQGIIDVFFEEDGELVLLDYKSDIVTKEEDLIKRYKIQLEYYRRALEQMLCKNVKEMIIYSLPLGKEIRIK